MSNTSMSPSSPLSARRSGGLGENLIFVLSFAAVLPVAAVARVSGWRWQPWPPGAAGYQTVVREARLAAGTITATVFSV